MKSFIESAPLRRGTSWAVLAGLLITASLLLLGCNQNPFEGDRDYLAQVTKTKTSSLVPEGTLPVENTATSTASIPIPSPSVPPDTGWQQLTPGLERRVINRTGEGESEIHPLYLLRIDPNHYRFDVAYQPGEARSLLRWGEETGARIVVNGGYFTEDLHAIGTVVTAGVEHGESFRDFGGMFSIKEGLPYLSWLREEPYISDGSISAGLQSFPMLVTPGGKLAYKEESADRARRTVIAQDYQRRILLLISPTPVFTLAEMGRFLVDSDLEIDAALNLDGGASTGLVLAEPREGVPALVDLPVVILVFPK